ncbi:MAG: hypothetical protein JNM56_20870 [Planctomycetia bacterium]|nr:hypothetical protein [Planctomycetia bacterium]
MIHGKYSLVRYISDPARGEAFNVGIITWVQNVYHVAIDREASRRAVKENPLLAKDSLRDLEAIIHSRLRRLTAFSDEGFLNLRNNHNWFPVLIADPEYVELASEKDVFQSLQGVADRLMDRMVRLRKVVTSRTILPDVKLELKDSLWPLIRKGSVLPNYTITGKRTGRNRQVDYFANGDAAIGLDILQTKSNQRHLRVMIDAEAYKIEDLSHQIKKHVVLSETLKDAKADDVDFANSVIESAGGKLVLSTAEALEIMQSAIAS